MDTYSQALTFGKDIIIAGDLNCDLLKPRSPEAIALLDFCSSVNFTQMIKQPTRLTSSTLINVIMTSNAKLVSKRGVAKINISDDYLVYATLKLKVLKPPPKYIISRSYKRYDPVSFTDELERIPWNETMSITLMNISSKC